MQEATITDNEYIDTSRLQHLPIQPDEQIQLLYGVNESTIPPYQDTTEHEISQILSNHLVTDG